MPGAGHEGKLCWWCAVCLLVWRAELLTRDRHVPASEYSLCGLLCVPDSVWTTV
jgi:hypothetical protein